MGLVCTAFATRCGSTARGACAWSTSRSWATSTRRGPLYAFFLVGQLPGLWTVAGALIIAAGLLVILFGRAEGETSVAAASEPEPL